MNYRFSDIVHIPTVQAMMENLWQASGIPVGIIDTNGTILVATGWQEICTHFHRKHPESADRCNESDAFIQEQLRQQGKLPEPGFIEYRCRNQMVDIAVPIIIEDQHLATLFLGQFFYEPPDEEEFRRQAREFGFDERTYLAALKKVPIFSRKRVEDILDFHTRFVDLIVQMGVQKLGLLKSMDALRESQKKFSAVFDQSPHLIGLLQTDGTVVDINQTALELGRCQLETVKGLPFWETPLWSHSAEERQRLQHYIQTAAAGDLVRAEITTIDADGGLRHLDLSVKPLLDDGARVSLLVFEGHDITDRKLMEKALREKEARYRGLYNNTPVMLHSIDAEGRLVSVSDFWLETMGYQRSEVLGRKSTEFLTAASRHQAGQRHLPKFFRTGQAKDIPHQFVKKNGEVIEVLLSATAERDEEGRILRSLAVLMDITDRKRAEQALQTAHRQLEDIIEFLPDATFVIDRDNQVVAWNRALEEMTGVKKEEVLGRGNEVYSKAFYDRQRPILVDLVGNPDQAAAAHYDFVERRGETLLAEVFVPSLYGGRGAYVWVIASPLLDQEGNRVGAIESVRDITDRKQVEMKLIRALGEAEEGRDKIAAILRSVSDGLMVTDLGNRIALINAPAQAMLGLKAENVLNRPIQQVLGNRDLVEHLQAIRTGAQTGAIIDWEQAEENLPEPRTIQAKSSIIRTREHARAGIITLLQDVTRERALNRMKSEFISTAAHELRTPLTSVKGFSELLLADQDLGDQQRREFLSYIHEKSLVLERIINDLLNLSRVESGRVIHLNKQPCDLIGVIDRLVTQYQREFKDHRFEINRPAENSPLLVDQGKIIQVLENLLSNAVKFSQGGSRIWVGCELTESDWRISVQDQGIGMTAEQRERVFDKFYRADASNTAISGLGLGMAIARSIVEAHGGRIWMESELGRGTLATFTLPRNPEAFSEQAGACSGGTPH